MRTRSPRVPSAHLEPAARTHSRVCSQALAVLGEGITVTEHIHSVGNSHILHLVGPAVRLLVGELAVIVLGVAAMMAVFLLNVHLDTAVDVVERLAPREVDQVAMVRHLLHRARELVVVDVAVAVDVGCLAQLANEHVGDRQVEVAHLVAGREVAGEPSAAAAAARGGDGARTLLGAGGRRVAFGGIALRRGLAVGAWRSSPR